MDTLQSQNEVLEMVHNGIITILKDTGKISEEEEKDLKLQSSEILEAVKQLDELSDRLAEQFENYSARPKKEEENVGT